MQICWVVSGFAGIGERLEVGKVSTSRTLNNSELVTLNFARRISITA